MSNLKLKLLLLTTVALFVASINITHAYDNAYSSNKNVSKQNFKKQYSSNKASSKSSSNKQYSSSQRSSNKHSNNKNSNDRYSKPSATRYQGKQYAQNSYRSRSDVMHEVKQRYNAKVLKISLNEKSGVYLVRVLMPNGKVRSLQVNARG